MYFNRQRRHQYKKIDSVAFSLSFDFDFMGVFEILEKLKIPFYKKDRDERFPLIFAGGPVITTNPKPYEAFFDFMLLGDGEESFIKVLEVLKQGSKKTETLRNLSNIDGVYVPQNPVKPARVKLNDVIYSPILSDKSYFKDTFIIEVSRGCMNRCSFCTASYTNLPFRVNEYEKIIQSIEFGLSHTNKIALLGAQISAHPKFNDIMAYLKDKMASGIDIELGISSLRTDSVTPEMVQTLVMGGQKHSTIAIEAASERLRKFLNKNLSGQQIRNAVNIARENGLKGLKVYCMIGIPTETEKDIEEFINLAKILKSENKGFNIEFSFSTFVPKPQTPLQWAGREPTKSLEKKQKYLEKELAKIGIQSKFSSAKWDYWQTVLSRGDETISPLMVEVFNNGGNVGAYKTASKNLQIDVTKFVEGFDKYEELPWDCVKYHPTKEQLLKIYEELYLLYKE